MKKENNATAKINTKESPETQSKFIEWIKVHSTDLLLAGISISGILCTALCLKNEHKIQSLWNDLKNTLSQAIPKNIKDLSDIELSTARDNANKAFQSSGEVCFETLRNRLDMEISRRKWNGKIPHGPSFKREDGFSLYRPD